MPRFHNHSHISVYKLYFSARTVLYRGKWLTVTFTPKGNDVSLEDMLSRVKSALAKERSIDFAIFTHETDNTNHFHGFIHCGSTKLTKLRSDDLVQLLIARPGPPEGWIGYMFKKKPDHYYKYTYKGFWKIIHRHQFDFHMNEICIENKISINNIEDLKNLKHI